MIKVLFAAAKVIRRILSGLLIVILLTTNILAVTSSAFNEILHGLLSYTPAKQYLDNSPTAKKRKLEAENSKIKQRNSSLINEQKRHKVKLAKARQISQRVTKRVARNVAKNVAAIPTEAIPYFGVAAVVTITALDVKDGCDTVRDVNQMMEILEFDRTDTDEQEVCGIAIPSAEEVLENIKQDLGGTTHVAKERISDSARKAYEALGGTVYEIFH